jgi:hypothetical protein
LTVRMTRGLRTNWLIVGIVSFIKFPLKPGF